MDSRRFRRTESPSQCGIAEGVPMTNAVSSARDHYAGQTYQDIALADGDDLPPVLRDRSNPPQPIADIPFSRYTDRAFFDLGTVILAARVRPDGTPHFLHFPVAERKARVAAEGYIGDGLLRVAAITKHRRQVIPIGQGDVLIG